MGMGSAQQRRFVPARSVTYPQFMAGRGAIRFQHHPYQRALGRGACSGLLHRGADARSALVAQILPDDGVIQYPAHALILRRGKAMLDPFGSIGLGQQRRPLPRQWGGLSPGRCPWWIRCAPN